MKSVMFRGLISLAQEILIKPAENRHEVYFRTIRNVMDDCRYLDYPNSRD